MRCSENTLKMAEIPFCTMGRFLTLRDDPHEFTRDAWPGDPGIMQAIRAALGIQHSGCAGHDAKSRHAGKDVCKNGAIVEYHFVFGKWELGQIGAIK